MARVTGLEPATSGVTGRHSNQLSYTRVFPTRSSAPRRGASFRRGGLALSSDEATAHDSFSVVSEAGAEPGRGPREAANGSQEKPFVTGL